MSKFLVVTPLGTLCAAALATAGCRVYDTELVDKTLSVVVASAGTGSRGQSDTVAAPPSSEAGAPAIARALPACGNGRLDEAERCDVAIPQTQPGACPDGCAQEGCFARHLEGTRCGARCVAAEITESKAGDGCCPSGATPETDSDCSPSCGNGRRDGAETCDPQEQCPVPSACKTELACMAARYTGSPDTCSARCELIPIVACTDGDGCCPSGCTQQGDDDCVAIAVGMPQISAVSGAAGMSGSGAYAGASSPPPSAAGSSAPPGTSDSGTCTGDCQTDSSARRCLELHSAGTCQACDCAYCSDQFLKCEDLTNEMDKSACLALLQCATRNRCTGLDCYCGGTSVSVCASGFANGPCAWEVRSVAGAYDVVSIFQMASAVDGPLQFATNALACRSQHCKRACSL